MWDYVESKVLQEGEKVVWSGRPNQFRVFFWAMRSWPFVVFLTVFGGLFTGFAFHGNGASDNAMAVLFGMVVFFGGLFLALNPVLQYQAAGRTRYAVTDQRILIIEAGNERDVVSIRARDISDYLRSDRGDGTGDIQLRKTAHKSNKHGTSYSAEFMDALWGVDDVKGAADAIAALRTA